MESSESIVLTITLMLLLCWCVNVPVEAHFDILTGRGLTFLGLSNSTEGPQMSLDCSEAAVKYLRGGLSDRTRTLTCCAH